MADISQVQSIPEINNQLQNLVYIVYAGAAGGVSLLVKEFWASVFKKQNFNFEDYTEAMRSVSKRLDESNEIKRHLTNTLDQAVSTNKLAMDILREHQEMLRELNLRTRNMEDHVVNLWKHRAEV